MDPTPPSPPRSPRKRLRMDDGVAVSVGDMPERNEQGHNVETMDSNDQHTGQAPLHKEADVGIFHHVSSDVSGFEGLLKKRYTDFLVNEILPNGTVVHLDSLHVPNLKARKQQTDPAAEPEEGATETVGASKAPSADTVDHSEPQTVPVEVDAQNAPPDEKIASDGGEAASTTTTGAAAWRDYAAQHKGFTLTAEDRTILESFLGESETNETLALYNRILESPHRKGFQYGTVRSGQTIDRAARTDLHQAIRRIFASRLESNTELDGTFVLSAASGAPNGRAQNRRQQGRGGTPQLNPKQKFAELGGDFVHFSLYKENKDTMEVTTYMARQLHLQPKSFQFAGTKDRRAITVQRVSVYRVMANALASLNPKLRNAKIGNFSYERKGLNLGELSGNEFVITLRECKFPGTEDLPIQDKVQAADGIVRLAVKNLVENGFINYYGMQRFGTFSMRTDTVGTKLLKGDFEGAIDVLLHYHPGALEAAKEAAEIDTIYSHDDKARALAIKLFRQSGNSHAALDKLPRKFSGESNVIRYLGGKSHKTDYLGAILSIPRALRMMYVHAYQSLVWNHAASYRWANGGATVLEGDLVLVREHKDKETRNEPEHEVDADGEVIVRPAQDDRAMADEERFERARPLSKEEAESGEYTIHDVVIPSPGFDVLYPTHMVRFFEELMAKEEFGGLDPHNMRRSTRDLSLSGHYRKLLAKPLGAYDCRVVAYAEENEQFVKTDVDRLNEARKLAQAKRDAQKKLQLSTQAESQTEAQMDHPMGMDGAAESKIKDFKNALLGTGAETSAEEAAAPSVLEPNGANEHDSNEAKEEDAMDTTSAGQPEVTNDSQPVKDKLAVVLSLQLGTSTYATMALRELAKGGIKPYKPEYGQGR